MPRPELDYVVIMEIMNARAEGLTLGQIQERMKVIREAGGVIPILDKEGMLWAWRGARPCAPPE